MLCWKNRASGKEIKAFSAALVDDIAKRFPPDLSKFDDNKVTENRLTNILERAYEQAQKFKREKRIGYFGIAKIANEFKWGLKELGYTTEFIDLATEGLVVTLSKNDPKPPSKNEKQYPS